MTSCCRLMRVGERLADANVLELRVVLLVDAQVEDVERPPDLDLEALGLQAGPVDRVREVDDVDLARLKFLLTGGLVSDGPDDHLVDLGLVAPVVIVAVKRDDLGAGVVAGELERAGAGGVQVRVVVVGEAVTGLRDLVGVVLLQRLGARHRERRERERRREGALVLVERQHRGVAVVLRLARLVDGRAGGVALVLGEAAPDVGVVDHLALGASALHVEPAVQVEADGFGVEVRAVVELHTLTQVEGDLLAVGADFPLLGQAGRELGGARGVLDQRLVHLTDRPEALAVVVEDWVEVLGRAGGAEGKGATGTLFAALALCARSDRRGEGRAGRDHYRLADSIHVSPCLTCHAVGPTHRALHRSVGRTLPRCIPHSERCSGPRGSRICNGRGWRNLPYTNGRGSAGKRV